jgi:hypothetical protein
LIGEFHKAEKNISANPFPRAYHEAHHFDCKPGADADITLDGVQFSVIETQLLLSDRITGSTLLPARIAAANFP